MKDIKTDKILILDFGSQYTQLIARRIREIGVYCELWAWDVPFSKIKEFAPKGIILSGGPETVTAANAPLPAREIYDMNIPIFGICYGMQAMALQLGGNVIQGHCEREFGYAEVELIGESNFLHNLFDQQTINGIGLLDVWMSHGDKVAAIPNNFTPLGKTQTCPFAIMADAAKHFYGVQFHPEVTHTKQGLAILERFTNICKCEKNWSASSIIDDAVLKIKNKVGNDKVILGLSGGVDSSVAALLLHRAIGNHLTCVFIDNGLLRLNEAEQVMEMFGQNIGLNIIHVKAEDRFMQRLEGIFDPEEKRKIIGNIFVEIFDEQASKIEDAKWLAQGTIYPDVIESAGSSTGKAHVIKSHHNVGGLPKDMKLGLVEPLRELFKDEVRKIGLELGLSYEMLYRHPFPGPGLGVRILGEVKKEYCSLLKRADAIFIEELRLAGLYHEVSQAFVVFLPVRSVGVMGDGRKYDWVVSLRAVETIDFMTAHWAHLPYELLGKVSHRIINEIDGISRVVYDISGKPPATIEWE